MTVLGNTLQNVRHEHPLVHCITNFVTANDCANILNAVDASPIMAHAIEEVEELVVQANALCVNIGTLSQTTIPSMFLAARKAASLEIPAVLDPVGAGASHYRTETALNLLSEKIFTLVRGNISEIRALAGLSETTRGTEASRYELLQKDDLAETIEFSQKLAQEYNVIVGISGPIDIIVNKERGCLVFNGNPIMPQLSGTGCMLSTLCAAFLGANRSSSFNAVVAAFCMMGVCGERAFEDLQKNERLFHWRNHFLDRFAQLSSQELDEGARYEFR